MTPLSSAVVDVGALAAVSSQVLVTSVAAFAAKRVGLAAAVPTRLRGLWASPRYARAQKHGEPTIGFHVTTPAQNLDVRRLVIACVSVLVMAIDAASAASITRAKPVESTRSVAFGIRLGVVAFPCGPLVATHDWFSGPFQIPATFRHGHILAEECQRCHLRYDLAHHKANAAATRRSKKQNGELFTV